MLLFGIYQEVGYLLREGLIDIEAVCGMMGTHNLLLPWEKFKLIILAHREKYHDPEWFINFEYFGEQIKAYRVRKGISSDIYDADGYITT